MRLLPCLATSTKNLFLIFIALALAGCATKQELLKPGEFSGTSTSLDYVKISYSIAKRELLGYDGLTLQVDLTNEQTELKEFSPEIYIVNSVHRVVAMPSLELVLSAASRQAGRPIPSEFLNPSANFASFSGTAKDRLSGAEYSVNGRIVRGNSFSRGFEMGSGIAAVAQRNEAGRVMDWAAAKWLKGEYRLPPKVTMSGDLFMPLFGEKISDPGSRLLVLNRITGNSVQLYIPPFVRD